MQEGRVKNSLKNMSSGLIVQILTKIINFVVRTFFIMYLSADYLGVNGLFSNILTMLSLAEMGIGTAIIYKMYKPIAENNIEKIKGLMKLYKKIYIYIGIITFIIGLGVIPFMNVIIKDAPSINENLYFIYMLFLVNTSSSYFFTFKKSIIIAYQKQNVINIINIAIYSIKSALEIFILIFTRNYVLFLIIEILSTILGNVIISIKANKMYPYLNDNDVVDLSKLEKKSIFSKIKSLIVYKFGEVVLNGTDNLLISSMVGIKSVALCSNYTLIINAVKSVLQESLNSVTASIGNLNVTASSEKKEEIYYQYTFIYYIISSFVSIAFVVMLRPLINAWIGEKYLLGFDISIVLSINFFIDSLRQPGYIYRTTLGMFEKSKATPYIGAILNIILSILLCKQFGFVGIFIATGVSVTLSYSWIDPYLLHKYVFDSSFLTFLKKYFIYVFTFTVELILCILICNMINVDGINSLIIKISVVLIIPNILNFLFYYKSKEFKMSLELLKKIIKK